MNDDEHDLDGESVPICSACGVTALPSEVVPDGFVCENPDCDVDEL